MVSRVQRLWGSAELRSDLRRAEFQQFPTDVIVSLSQGAAMSCSRALRKSV
jgi:hypothetical protein